MRWVINFIVLLASAVAFANQELVCSLERVIPGAWENSETYPHDETIRLSLSYDKARGHILVAEGKNLGTCRAEVSHASGHEYIATNIGLPFEQTRRCNISSFIMSWSGSAEEIDTQRTIAVTSRNMFVVYGEGQYSCKERR